MADQSRSFFQARLKREKQMRIGLLVQPGLTSYRSLSNLANDGFKISSKRITRQSSNSQMALYVRLERWPAAAASHPCAVAWQNAYAIYTQSLSLLLSLCCCCGPVVTFCCSSAKPPANRGVSV